MKSILFFNLFMTFGGFVISIKLMCLHFDFFFLFGISNDENELIFADGRQFDRSY